MSTAPNKTILIDNQVFELIPEYTSADENGVHHVRGYLLKPVASPSPEDQE